MTPNILLQIFKRHRPWLTLFGWVYVGGFTTALVIVCTLILRGH